MHIIIRNLFILSKMKTYVLFASIATMMACGSCAGHHEAVATFAEAADPYTLTEAEQQQWTALKPGLHAAWSDADVRCARGIVPVDTAETQLLTAWKGEREGALLLLWSADSVPGATCTVSEFRSDRSVLPASIADARFVRYALADSAYKIGFITEQTGKVLKPDMIDSLRVFDMSPQTVRPLWLSVSVPRDAEAGTYSATVTVSSADGQEVSLPLSLHVLDHVLPPPSEWTYHLDLWQHPAAVARAQGLDMWSDEHFAALRPLMERLAGAGQKVITATLNKDPWNHQCHDAYANMIDWTLKSDGTWSYDYAVFDRWVELMMSVGIDRMINCYSMVPWNCELEYFDEAADSVVTVSAEPGSDTFRRVWSPFLTDFKSHLAQKGWLEITNIAMDERAPEAMDATVRLVGECAPELGLALADDHKSYRRYPDLRDICINQNHPADHNDILERRAKGLNTTFYVCCGPEFPNTFTFSAPYEAELLGWFGLGADFDGMLRWTYNSWPENPQYDTTYGYWSSGDTFMVYPWNRSSLRFERLIDGIESAEKVRLLRAAGTDTSELDSILVRFTSGAINDPTQPWRQTVRAARAALNRL